MFESVPIVVPPDVAAQVAADPARMDVGARAGMSP